MQEWLEGFKQFTLRKQNHQSWSLKAWDIDRKRGLISFEASEENRLFLNWQKPLKKPSCRADRQKLSNMVDRNQGFHPWCLSYFGILHYNNGTMVGHSRITNFWIIEDMRMSNVGHAMRFCFSLCCLFSANVFQDPSEFSKYWVSHETLASVSLSARLRI
jgi:hypothetical protein